MKIRRELERFTDWMKRERKGRKALLVALSVLLSLNIVLSAMPRSAFAAVEAVSNMNELLEAIRYAGSYNETEIAIDSDFEINETIVIDYGAKISLRPSFGDVTLRRAAGFEGELFRINGNSASAEEDGYVSGLTVGDGVTIDGNSGAVIAEAPLVYVDESAVLTVCGELVNNDNGAAASRGGAVYSDGGMVVIDGGSVCNNSAYVGGGICMDEGSFTVKDGSVESNVATYMGGGAYLSGCSAMSISGTATDNAVITENTAPIGAGLYLCDKPLSNPEYKISGTVIIDDNATLNTPMALPDSESNIFMEKSTDVPSFGSLSRNSMIGIYPMENNTVIPSTVNYITQNPAPVFFDHDESILKGYTTYANGAIKILAPGSVKTVPVFFGEEFPKGCSVVTDMGQEIVGGFVVPGFPVHLVAKTDGSYVIPEDSLDIALREDSSVIYEGSVANGIWYSFTGDEYVKAGFTSGVPVARVNDVNYATLSEAFASCINRPYSEIELLKDLKSDGAVNYSLSECIVVPSGCEITLFAGEKANTIRRSQSYNGSLFQIEDHAVLNLVGLVLDGNSLVRNADYLVSVYGDLVLDNSKIRYSNGGGAFVSNGTLEFKNKGRIEENTADYGAGVYMNGSDSRVLGDGNPDTLEIGRNKYAYCGGGIYMEDGIVSGCVIYSNTPAASSSDVTMGGGIYAEKGRVINSVVGAYTVPEQSFSNTADRGAGIYAVELAMKDVSVLNNSASEYAGGVYCDKPVLSGKVVIDKNVAVSSASDLYVDTDSTEVIRINGQLDDSSEIKVFLSDDGSAANDRVIARSDSELINAANVQFFSLENTDKKVLTAKEKDIVLKSSAECISVELKTTDETGAVSSTPAFGSVIEIEAVNGKAMFVVSNPHGLDLTVTSSDASAVSAVRDDTDDYAAGGECYVISALEGAKAGSKYTVTVGSGYEYESGSLYEYDVPVDGAGTTYYAYNEYYSPMHSSVDVKYSAAKMNPYANVLDVEYIEWGSPNADSTVKTQMSAVKEAVTDSFDGYFRIEPGMTDTPADNSAVLGSLTEVPYVTITMNVSCFAEDGETIDVVSYNGMVDGNKTVGGKLHKDLLVKDGMVSFDVTRGTGKNPDVVYAALVQHGDYAASIGTGKYLTLAEAFAEAKTGDEIKVLRDVKVFGGLVVPEGKAITVSSESGARIIRSENYGGAIFYVDPTGELTLKNIILDGGAEIVSTAPLTNSGAEGDAALVANHGKLSVSGCSGFENGCVSENYSSDSCRGGALYNGETGKASIKDAGFAGNYANEGGAVYNLGELVLDNCLLTDNTAKSNGGAVYSKGTLKLVDTYAAYNSCAGTGVGGVYNSGKLSVSGDVNIASNTGASGAPSNVANAGDTPIIICGALPSSARIGVSNPSKSGAVIAEGDGTNVSDASAYKINFFPDSSSLTVEADTANKTVVLGSKTATYVTVTLSAGANGTISPVGDVRVASGDSLKITVTPSGSSDSAYAIADILVDGSSVLSSATIDSTTGVATYTLSDIKADRKVEASFKRAPGSTITPTASTGGKISPSGKLNVNSEESVEFTVTPDEGYYLDTLKLSGKDVLDKAVRNSDGSYTYTASGITDANATLNADFKPIYAARTLVDAASGVEITGSLHYKAKLSVENLAKASESLYNQMKEALDKTSADFTQYIAQAYEIKLVFDDEQGMEGWSKIKPGTTATLTFNLGDSYEGKTVRIFHHNGSRIETDKAIEVIKADGKISAYVTSLSPFAVVVQEPKSSTGTGGTGGGTGGTGGGTTGTLDGKGPVSGDYYQPKTVPPVVIVLVILSSATILFIVGKYYLPRFIKYLRGRYSYR